MAFPVDQAEFTALDHEMSVQGDSAQSEEVVHHTPEAFAFVVATPDPELQAGRGKHPPAAIFLLLPCETGAAKAVDQAFYEMAHRVHYTTQIVILGVAPPPSCAMRWISFGHAAANRLKAADELKQRADRIADRLEKRRCGAAGTSIIIAAEGDRLVEDVVLRVARDYGLVRVYMDRGPPVMFLFFSNAEKCVRRLVPASIPVTVFKKLPLQSAADLLYRADATGPDNVTPRRALVVIDPDDYSVRRPLPLALSEALGSLIKGDGIFIYMSVPLPEAAEALQLSGDDWTTKMRRALKNCESQLADLKKLALNALSRRKDGGSGISVGTFVSERHYAEGIPKAIQDFKIEHVFLSSEFMRQRIFRGAYESLYGSEYERLMKVCPHVHFTIA